MMTHVEKAAELFAKNKKVCICLVLIVRATS